MISVELAAQLRASGLEWHPKSGDAFGILSEGFDDDVFTVSDMTIEPYEFESGTVLGFNGTTEWALDSVALDDAIWLPREDQLRELLRGTFRSLVRTTHGFSVEVVILDREFVFAAEEPADAYALALLELLGQVA